MFILIHFPLSGVLYPLSVAHEVTPCNKKIMVCLPRGLCLDFASNLRLRSAKAADAGSGLRDTHVLVLVPDHLTGTSSDLHLAHIIATRHRNSSHQRSFQRKSTVVWITIMVDTNLFSPTSPLIIAYLMTALFTIVAPEALGFKKRIAASGLYSSPARQRKRRSVSSIFHELGPYYLS